MTTYTSQYFSPIIIDVELAHVRGPAGQELADDNMTIKVAAAVNEVLASYLVDGHQLEIKLKIPPDWPLHKVEVRDLKRVGVDNDRWRAWILAVQQMIWSSVRTWFLYFFEPAFDALVERPDNGWFGSLQEECNTLLPRTC